jgi:hypothetical protein
MKQELDKLLCEKYPKMMVNRNSPMTETCMCWGFECGDGWYNILNQLMGNIQHHLDWKEKQRQWAIDFNSKAPTEDMRSVPEAIPQVTLDQVKEKFGTLRFYYTGGDDYISGMVTMAEAMSGCTCESCGNPAERDSNGGWVRTICDPCEEQRDARRAKELEEYHAMNEKE